jgi:hypothetical protein
MPAIHRKELDKLLTMLAQNDEVDINGGIGEYIEVLEDFGYAKRTQGNKCKITVKGHMFHGDGGFKSKKRTERIRNLVQIAFWAVSAVALLYSSFLLKQSKEIDTAEGGIVIYLMQEGAFEIDTSETGDTINVQLLVKSMKE